MSTDWTFSYEWDKDAEKFACVSHDVRGVWFDFYGSEDLTNLSIAALERAEARLTVSDTFRFLEHPAEGWHYTGEKVVV